MKNSDNVRSTMQMKSQALAEVGMELVRMCDSRHPLPPIELAAALVEVVRMRKRLNKHIGRLRQTTFDSQE